MKKEAATFQQERDLAFEFMHLLSPTPQLTGRRELRSWCVCGEGDTNFVLGELLVCV